MNTIYLQDFSEKQIQTIKTFIRDGFWGDCDMNFAGNPETEYTWGFFTHLKKGSTENAKVHSGICSGISKKIKETQNKAFCMVSDWWGEHRNGKGDMFFCNMNLLVTDYDDLKKWANS